MLRKDLPVARPSDTGVPLIPIDAIAGIPAGDNLGLRFIDCEHYIVPEFANLNVEYMIRVSGSSMYPKYSNGDILACRRVQDILFFQWGKIYVIDSSQGALVKRVFEDEDPERILLVSDNKEKYPPFSIPKSDIRSVSIVLGVIRLE
ncbi:MAG: S24 family peptidase [Bacteroidales bacterium]|nr:S24 family peptidase [Bacteroidales bacterium]